MIPANQRKNDSMTTQNKTALITGASRGLGLALARELAKLGWTLMINARGGEALQAARDELQQHTTVIAIVGDVTSAEHRHALANAAQRVGGLDAVINNASILGLSPQPNLLDYPLDVIEEVYLTNVIAPLGVLQAVKDSLKSDARIINVTSDAGVEAYPGWGGYGSSKAALEHLSAILAAENPQWRVYVVDPGDMQTQMHQEAFPGEDISDRALPEASVPGFIDLLTGDLPGGRYKAREVGQPPKSAVNWLNLVLTVTDFEQALTFYRDGLGMPIKEEWHEIGHGVMLDAGRATLELLDTTHAAEVDRIEAGQHVGAKVRLALSVKNVEQAAESLIEQGAEAPHETVMTPWGHRNRRLIAPDGTQITLFQVVDGVGVAE
jgi:NAD(P)-dependent dehydrogenase (short-subunit alcohol dehydrogenase family)/catechol 2,3-dioxygenase-like lactoylglutathione lyase family enzyme